MQRDYPFLHNLLHHFFSLWFLFSHHYGEALPLIETFFLVILTLNPWKIILQDILSPEFWPSGLHFLPGLKEGEYGKCRSEHRPPHLIASLKAGRGIYSCPSLLVTIWQVQTDSAWTSLVLTHGLNLFQIFRRGPWVQNNVSVFPKAPLPGTPGAIKLGGLCPEVSTKGRARSHPV